MKYTYKYQSESFSIDLRRSGGNHLAAIENHNIPVEFKSTAGNRLDMLIDGHAVNAFVTHEGTKRWVTINGQTFVLVNSSGSEPGSKPAHPDSLSAQMPGLVRSVNVSEGDMVKKGQTLAVIEAMKMENKVTAPFAGRVKKLMIKPGQTVEREQILVELSNSHEE